MENLTTKELAALEDQLNFEGMLCGKYQTAAQDTGEGELRERYTQYAKQHKQNYDTLLSFLR